MKSWSSLSHLKIKMGRRSNNFNLQKICVELSVCSVNLIIELKVSILQVPTLYEPMILPRVRDWVFHLMAVCVLWLDTGAQMGPPFSRSDESGWCVLDLPLPMLYRWNIALWVSPCVLRDGITENRQRSGCLHRDTHSLRAPMTGSISPCACYTDGSSAELS